MAPESPGRIRLVGRSSSHFTRVASTRDVSLLEVTLFCLVEHVAFRHTLPLEPHPGLVRFASSFAKRPAAVQTLYRYDPPPRS